MSNMKYRPLIGLCKDCLYKCGKCENPLFMGVKQCEYYESEKQIPNNKWVQERIGDLK